MKRPKGFKFSGIDAGIKKTKKRDLGLILCESLFPALGFFTKNVNPAYSVTLSKQNINNPIKAVIVNSGNANCYTDKSGLTDTKDILINLAKELKVSPKNILIASTGIIGKKLPKEKIVENIPGLIKECSGKINHFSQSILTTDSQDKVVSKRAGKGVVLGIAKGAGMIAPNMGTMLGFVLTNVKLSKLELKRIFSLAIEKSFNSITIDGCMSTNDTVFVLSSEKVRLNNSKEVKEFETAVNQVCLGLAKKIVSDAEGQTSKYIELNISGAKTEKEAKLAGLAIANSFLVKAAIYGALTNWGRIVAALGQVGIKVNEDIEIKASSLKKKKILITVDLKRGQASWVVYTTDITPEYLAENAGYS